MAFIRPRIHPNIIFRIPRIPLDASLSEYWDVLKEAISMSSPEFYQQIEAVNYSEFDKLPEKTRLTIRKYFNRARFRQAPYGNFSAIGLIRSPSENQQGTVIVDDRWISHRFADWTLVEKAEYTFDQLMAANGLLLSNSSFYPINDRIRYISRNDSRFELSDIDYDRDAAEVLSFCSTARSINEVIECFGDHREKILALVEDMILVGLLLTSFDPGIIGEDFFKKKHIPLPAGEKQYIITEKQHKSGYPDKQLLNHFPKLLRTLQEVTDHKGSSDNFKDFVRRFAKRYDRQEVPLMEALDPEIGIGYSGLEQAATVSPLIRELVGHSGNDHGSTSQLGQFLRNHLQEYPDGLPPIIHLEKIPLEGKAPRYPLANTIPALITVADDLVVLEHLGGCSANALTGRFSVISKDFLAHCREIAYLEQSSNPGVIFFDVSYTAEPQVDNINRRAQIYPYQLSILNWDDSNAPIRLNDIYIRLQAGELVLISKSLGKRLIPRIATAYNFTRSDLPVYRFLCDLQYQGVQGGLSFSLPAEIPGLKFYPRVQFEHIVLSRASWRLEQKKIVIDKDTDLLMGLRHYLDSVKAPRYIRIGTSEQKQTLDCHDQLDLRLLADELRRFKALIAEEALLPESSMLKDQDGRPYHGQYLLTFTHQQELFSTTAPLNIPSGLPQRKFFPGCDWLYLELYCHPSRANNVLQQVRKMMESVHASVKKWFFIRFDEGGPHLRLRFEHKDPGQHWVLLQELTRALEEEINQRLISDVQIKTYERELERYGYGYIDKIEEHFHQDSNFILSIMGQDDKFKYCHCLNLVRHLHQYILIDDEALLSHFIRTFDNFATEQDLATDGIKKINEFYKDHMNTELQRLYEYPELYNRFYHSFSHALANYPGDKLSLFSDLFHMHVNRLFAEHQRVHEMAVYSFLTKEWQKGKILRKHASGFRDQHLKCTVANDPYTTGQ